MIKSLTQIITDLKKYPRFYSICGLLFLQVFLTAVFPYLLGQIIDQLGASQQFYRFLILFVGVVLLNSLLQWLIPPLYQELIETYVADLRQSAMTTVQNLPMARFEAYGKGDLVSRIVVDSNQVSQGLTMMFSQFLTGLLSLALTVIMMATINIWLLALVLVLTPLSLIISKTIAQRAYQSYQKQTKLRGQVSQFIDERLAFLTTIQANNAQSSTVSDFNQLNQTYAEASQRAIFYSSTVNPLTRFVNATIYALLIALGAYQIFLGRLTLGQLTSFLTYVNQYTKPFNDLSSVFAEFQATQASLERLQELTNLDLPSQAQGELPKTIKGQISFEQVSFAYQDNQPIINNLNLDIPAGAMVGIVGPTGAGKSTLINLLMRFYQPSSGRIFLDNQDIAQLSSSVFYQEMGLVLQDTWIKKSTVADNIAYGRPDASREEVVAAAQAANADFFIRQLPQGYDTMIDGDTVQLSQGQEQLLAIARVFLKSPKILIFDEATASLDSLTESLVQSALAKLMAGRTSLVIAHRLATVRDADLIVVLQDGQIVQKGNHNDLKNQEGIYRELLTSNQGD